MPREDSQQAGEPKDAEYPSLDQRAGGTMHHMTATLPDHQDGAGVDLPGGRRIEVGERQGPITSGEGGVVIELNPELLPRIPSPRLTDVIGSGGMGEFSIGHENELQRRVAVKQLLPDTENVPTQERALMREAQIMAQLAQPHVLHRATRDFDAGRLSSIEPAGVAEQ